MAIEKDDATDRWKYVTAATKVVGATLFFVLIPVAVARNAYGFGDRLSVLPGITEGGGAGSGIVAAIYILGVIGVACGAMVATGADVPMLDGGAEPPESTATATAIPTPTPTATAKPTATPTATPTETPSAAERRQMQLEAFQADYLGRLEHTMENESLLGVPVLGSAYRETDDGTLELWVVFWECDYAQEENTQWFASGARFVGTAGTHDGAQPDRLRVYGVTNLTNFNDAASYIRTSEAELVYNRTRDPAVFTENWMERKHEPSQSENRTAYEIAVNDSGKEVADRAFYDDHADGRDAFKCNGGAVNRGSANG